MSADMMLVLTVVLIPVTWVGAYFWIADARERRAAREAANVQEADIVVNGGYRPSRLVLAEGRPLRLRITRTSDGESWWDDLEFPYARVARALAQGDTVTVDVGPLEPGEYALFSALGTMRGTLVIEGAPDGGLTLRPDPRGDGDPRA